MIRRLLLCLLPLLAAAASPADSSARAHPLHLEKNYRQDYDSSVIRTPDGYLWITSHSGLKRYDGYNLRLFNHEPGDPTTLGSSIVMRALLHSDGSLWTLGSA